MSERLVMRIARITPAKWNGLSGGPILRLIPTYENEAGEIVRFSYSLDIARMLPDSVNVLNFIDKQYDLMLEVTRSILKAAAMPVLDYDTLTRDKHATRSGMLASLTVGEDQSA